jgi:hypothetical protein
MGRRAGKRFGGRRLFRLRRDGKAGYGLKWSFGFVVEILVKRGSSGRGRAGSCALPGRSAKTTATAAPSSAKAAGAVIKFFLQRGIRRCTARRYVLAFSRFDRNFAFGLPRRTRPPATFACFARLAITSAALLWLFKVGRFALLFKKIGDVEESVALKADIDKSRLHAGQHAGDASLIDGARERVFVLPLVVNLG